MKLARFPVLVFGTTMFVACGEEEGARDVSPDTAETGDTSETNEPLALDPRCHEVLAGCLERQRTCIVEGDEARCVACAPGLYPDRSDGVCRTIPGTPLSHVFADQTIEAGEEIGSLCQSWVLNNDEPLWVNAVEMDNDGGYHHSNWFFVPEDFRDWPTEPWMDCYDDGFHEIDAALAGGVLYAQSTQVRRELQKFQPGAAVRIPPRSRIITVTHLLNYLPDALTTGLRMTIHTLPESEVLTPLTPAQLIYTDLQIPGKATSTFSGTCDLAASWSGLFPGEPMDIKVHYVLPHYHDLGDGFEVALVGGPRDGEKIVELGSYSTDPFGFAFDPPIDLSEATGLSFTCRFKNPRDATVRWGIGDQEMCEALLFLESPMAFSAGVNTTSTESTISGGVDDGVRVFGGECGVLAFPYDPRDN